MAVSGFNVAQNLGQELLNVPMGEMIRSMAQAIASAQTSLDRNSMVVAELMSGHRPLRDPNTLEFIDRQNKPTTTPVIDDSRITFGYTYVPDRDGKPQAVPNLVSMMELGFVPNFYQFVDTVI